MIVAAVFLMVSANTGVIPATSEEGNSYSRCYATIMRLLFLLE